MIWGDIMKEILEQIAVGNGDRLKVIPIEYLHHLKNEINEFEKSKNLNGFQKYIVNNMYQFEPVPCDFEVKSVILVAAHHPFYAKVTCNYKDKDYEFLSLVRSDFNKVTQYVKDAVKGNIKEAVKGNIKEAVNLPLKRLGVHSGLAQYGKNNITYVKDLGSNFSYIAYYSDIENDEFVWQEDINAKICGSCTYCFNSCPTGAIAEYEFLIDNMKCLSFFNESSDEMPDWIHKGTHHTFYDCLMCQRGCPMNQSQEKDILETIHLNSDEMEALLSGTSIDLLNESLHNKVMKLGIFEWYGAIPRNIRLLLDNSGY